MTDTNDAQTSLPEEFGPFVLASLIHRGGMGELFFARADIPGYPVVVVKRLRPDLGGIVPIERFRHEGELAVRLQHPNVVQALSVGTVERRRYLALEPIVGQSVLTLSDRLVERNEKAPIQFVTRVMVDALSALAYLHAACDEEGRQIELIHRDVTPGNVLIGYDGEVKITDLGVARSLMTEGKGLTQPGTVVGTPAYVAPEFLKGDDLSPVVDIYGLGGVAYRLLTGSSPFPGSVRVVVMKVMGQTPRPCAELRPDAPLWLTDLIDRMLAHDPNERPPNALELKQQLSRVAEGLGCLASNAQLGRWMSTLFQRERARDEATVRAVSLINLETLAKARKSRTIVLAQTGSAPRLLPKITPPPRKASAAPVVRRPSPRDHLRWPVAALLIVLALAFGVLATSPRPLDRFEEVRSISTRLDVVAVRVLASEDRAALRLLRRADRAFARGDYDRAELHVRNLERSLAAR